MGQTLPTQVPETNLPSSELREFHTHSGPSLIPSGRKHRGRRNPALSNTDNVQLEPFLCQCHGDSRRQVCGRSILKPCRRLPSTILDNDRHHAGQEGTEEDNVDVKNVGVGLEDDGVQGAHKLRIARREMLPGTTSCAYLLERRLFGRGCQATNDASPELAC